VGKYAALFNLRKEKQMEKMIKKIVIDIDGKEISLSPDQAQRLCAALMDLTGVKTQKEYVPYYPYAPWRPYWTWGTYQTSLGNGTLTCASTYNADSNTASITL
jgi:hypothetical protein